MSDEERKAYLELTLRGAPEGSARRMWAAAQLKALEAKSPTTAEQPATTKRRTTR